MTLSEKKTDFVPCPEYTGRAVCVDVTPLKRVTTAFGERDQFRLVFEVDMPNPDKGGNWCVWSQGFNPTLHEKASFRRFMRSWLGRDLTAEERSEYNLESLVGRAAFLVVTHTHTDEATYANIAACTPLKSGDPMVASGLFVRAKDRAGASSPEPSPKIQRPTQKAPVALAPQGKQEFHSIKVHVGKLNMGRRLCDLETDAVEKLVDYWLPAAKALANPSSQDRELMVALEWWQSTKAVAAAIEDDVPF